jgi:predicted ester cyclase
MTSDENRARVLELFEVVINGRDADAIPRFTVNPHIDGTLRSLLGAFSDLRFEVRWTVSEGSRVVAVLDMTGTHDSGPWLMVAEPTHQRLSASLVLAVEFDEAGMVVDNWLGTNFIAMLDQLGWGVAPRGQEVPG